MLASVIKVTNPIRGGGGRGSTTVTEPLESGPNAERRIRVRGAPPRRNQAQRRSGRLHPAPETSSLREVAEQQNQYQWYSVRCVFQTPHEEGFSYEERVTLWRAGDFDEAIALAEEEASEYAAAVSDETAQTEYVGLAQSYWLSDEPDQGAEVFSLIRDSTLDSDAYLERFFDTGTEHQRTS